MYAHNNIYFIVFSTIYFAIDKTMVIFLYVDKKRKRIHKIFHTYFFQCYLLYKKFAFSTHFQGDKTEKTTKSTSNAKKRL